MQNQLKIQIERNGFLNLEYELEAETMLCELIHMKTEIIGLTLFIICLIINKRILAERNIDLDREIELAGTLVRSAIHLDLIKLDFYQNGEIISLKHARELYLKELRSQQDENPNTFNGNKNNADQSQTEDQSNYSELLSNNKSNKIWYEEMLIK